MRTLHRLRKALRLPGRSFLRHAVLVLAARAVLAVFPFRSVLARARRLAHPRPGSDAPEPAERERIVRAVAAATRKVGGPRPCLPQSLVTWTLLRRAGHPAQLRLGVSRERQAALEAHAWVECDGAVLTGDRDAPARYAPFPALD